MIYEIVDWERRFENNRTRDLKKLGWVPVPNHHDGDGYTTLMEMDNGMVLYAAWMLMVQVASKCKKRGTLVRDSGTPYDAGSLARVTRGRKEVFEAAIPVLLEIRWLAITTAVSQLPAEKSQLPADLPQESAKIPQPHACAERKKDVKGTEKKELKEGITAIEQKPSKPQQSLESMAEALYFKYPKKVDPKKSQGYIVRHLKGFKDSPTHTEQESEFARLKVHLDGYLKSDRVKAGYLMDSTTFFNGHLQSDLEAFRDAPKNAQAPPRSRLPNVNELDGVPDLPDAYYEQNGIERPSKEQEVELRNGLATIGNFGEPPT